MTSTELRKNNARSLETYVCNSALWKEKKDSKICSSELTVNISQDPIIAS